MKNNVLNSCARLLFVVGMAGCNAMPEVGDIRTAWGEIDSRPVHLYTVANANGMSMQLTDYGAKLTSLMVPDRNGRLDDVVLGFTDVKQYVDDDQSIGSTVGRLANRIRHGRYEINGESYQLQTNERSNMLHSAGEFEKFIWNGEPFADGFGTGVRFSQTFPDGNLGFPGTLHATITYTLTDDNALRIRFEAVTDKPTHVNITHHGYFNLNGANATIHEHRVSINADTYVVLDGEGLATGDLESLDGKSWDLSEMTRLGDRMDRIPSNGYAHNYVAKKEPGEFGVVAQVIDPASGRTLQVSTTQPGVVFYASMGLNDIVGKYGIEYRPHIAFCLETQHHIGAPNHDNFPSTLLLAGDTYNEIAVYDFGVVDEP